jgi:short-subunit dehydrogenase
MICVDVNGTELNNFSDELKSKVDQNKFERLFFYKIDLKVVDEVNNFIETLKSENEEIHVLINLAGNMNRGKLFHALTEKEIQRIFNVNVFSQMWLCRALLPGMIERQSGHIINMSSSLGLFGNYTLIDYCSTKFAVNGFTEALRNELRMLFPKSSIRVSLVCPFHVKTKLFNGFNLTALRWLNISLEPSFAAKAILDGILLEKEIVGVPSFPYYMFGAMKKFENCHAFL